LYFALRGKRETESFAQVTLSIDNWGWAAYFFSSAADPRRFTNCAMIEQAIRNDPYPTRRHGFAQTLRGEPDL
jgi:hypothetical protein